MPQVRWPVGLGVGVALTTVALRLRDPHDSGSWGLCPSRALTGFNCPMCGGLRAVNDLTHGDLSAAWFSNALFVASIPLVVGLWIWWTVAAFTGRPTPAQHRWATPLSAGYAVLMIAFAVFRNTPWGSAYWA